MPKAKIYLGLFVVFLAGAVCGGVATASYLRCRIERGMEAGPAGMGKFVMRRLERELDLSPDQREQVQKIVQNTQERLRELRLEHEPKLNQIIDETVAEINPILTEAQREKLREVYARAKARFHEHGEGRRMDRHERKDREDGRRTGNFGHR